MVIIKNQTFKNGDKILISLFVKIPYNLKIQQAIYRLQVTFQDACLNNRCKNNAACQTGFTERGHRCSCDAGFEGQDCEIGELNNKKCYGQLAAAQL